MSLRKIQKDISVSKWPFMASFAVVFFVMFAFLSAIDFLPEVPSEVSERGNVVLASEASAEVTPVKPLRVVIDAIGVDMTIENPDSRDVAILDRALTKGAVRYPGSATLTEEGNMFLFGHSSHLPVVRNPAYQAFNDIETLSRGDTIRVQGEGLENLYRVTRVTLVDANEAWVDLSSTGRKLTLSTCNTFGEKSERYVVEAEFIGSYERG